LSTLLAKEPRNFAKRIGYMFQLGALFDSMTVFENLALPLVEHTKAKPEEGSRKVSEILHKLDLSDTEAKLPHELSGGMLKRVGLARALMLEPEVVFCDEPTAGLDPIRSKLVYDLLKRVRKTFGTTLIVVTHDTAAVPRFADRVALLYKGK